MIIHRSAGSPERASRVPFDGRSLFVLSALSVAVLVPVTGHAQDQPLTAGTRIRVRGEASAESGPRASAASEWQEGYVARANGDSLWMRPARYGGRIHALAWSRLEELQVSRGMGSDAGKGALYGAGAGTLIGAIVAVAMPKCTPGGFLETGNWFCASSSGTRFLVGALGTGLGAGVGAFIGSKTSSERWHGLSIPEVRTWLSAHQVGLTLRVPTSF